MQITLNGERASVPSGATIRDILSMLDLDTARKGVAVAVNAEVVPRSDWGTVKLGAGDRVDVIRPIQGG